MFLLNSDVQKTLDSEKKRTEKLKADLTKTEEELTEMKKARNCF